MLTRLHVQGYKALRDIETTFEPLTVIVGPNGCGKTSVLESIAMVQDFVVQPDEARARHPFGELLTKNGTSSPHLEVDLWMELDEVNQTLLRNASPDRNYQLKLALSHGKELEVAATVDSREHPSSVPPVFRGTPEGLAPVLLGTTRLLELDTRDLARPSYLREVVPRIGNSGIGLATVLSWLQGERHETFAEIQAQLREFVPDVEGIRTRRAPVPILETEDVPIGHDDKGTAIYTKRSFRREEIGNEVLLDFRHAKGIPAKHASEGTLLLLGLLTVVLTGDVTVLLLDDVDRALHPKAQQQLVGYLRRIARSGIQVIATTHSPYLVLHLEYEEVRAMTMSDLGGALIGKLTDHPEYERWREDMTPSEFWTVFGEEWLAKARTKAEGNG